MKKFLSLALSMVILISAMPLIVSAEEVEEPDVDTFIEGGVVENLSFESVEDLEYWLLHARKTGETRVSGKALSDFIISMDSLYLPKGVTLDDVTTVYISSERVSSSFDFGGESYAMYYYQNKTAARKQLDLAKENVQKKQNSARSKNIEGRTVYSYDVLYGARCYTWVQDGKVFELYINGGHKDSVYDLCFAVENKLSLEKTIPAKEIVPVITLRKGTSVRIGALLSPSNSTEKVVWKTGNSSIATVTQSGTIKAVEKGNVTITLSTESGARTRLRIRVID
ncbi:MAG: Ig-like domain-containing protein [Oscillospiraceae bacterium]|nr:Ig-like domain-containing protein [Oscillospiraceae bacterium]